MKIVLMRTDYMENPIGYDFQTPLLGWVVEAEGVNKRQSAYRLQVAADATFASPLYDSGKLASEQSVGVELPLPLSPRTRYYWRVMVWDERDTASDFSDAAFFETARYDLPWQARWIGSDIEHPQLRRGFAVRGPVARARAYACGVGMYCLFLNGQKVGDEWLTPGFNAYDSWIGYQTYDVTALLAQGENALGAWLGNGYYKGRVSWPGMPERRNMYGDKLGLILELDIEYADGTRETVLTDADWKAAPGPFARTEIYDGEVFDARLLLPGWNLPGFDDAAWEPVALVPIDTSKLVARRNPPVIVHERIAPIAVVRTPAGEQVLDFGQNMAGRVRLCADLPSGTQITLQFGEALDKDGNFYRDNMRTALAEQVYIAGGGPFEYAPYFTFFGFRYAKVTGWPGAVPAQPFVAEVMHSAMERTGDFTCSDERVNRLFLNAIWGQKSNFVDVPTDCPQRDERMGWTGDAQVFCATACMNMESDAFYRKYLYDLAIEQKKAGFVPVVVPNFLSGMFKAPSTGWADAATIMPWAVYQYFGDTAILRAQYESMKAWVDYMRDKDAEDTNLYGGFHLGDWLAQDTRNPDSPMGLTPTDLIATAHYAYSTRIVSKAARVLGYEDDAREYAALAERIVAAFQCEFVTPGGRVAAETQTADLVALYMDMLPAGQRAKVARHLSERIVKDGMQLTTGFIGTPILCPTLSENGYNEFAYKLLLNNKCPSWLFEVEHGATTIWERWNSVREDGSFGPVSMNSLNHYAFGSIAEWMYRYVAGLQPLEDAPGFRKLIVRPMPNCLLGHAQASIRTQYGMLRSGWKLEGDKITLDIDLPFNVEARIVLPDAEGAEVLENGAPVDAGALKRGSGHWRYEYTPNMQTIGKKVPEMRWG